MDQLFLSDESVVPRMALIGVSVFMRSTTCSVGQI